jgi:hypothetical protein
VPYYPNAAGAAAPLLPRDLAEEIRRREIELQGMLRAAHLLGVPVRPGALEPWTMLESAPAKPTS